MRSPRTIRRTRATWFAYAVQSLFGFALYGSGPIAALVRAELDLSYVTGSALPVVFTGGTVAGAAASGWLLRGGRRTGREPQVLGAAAGLMALGFAVLGVPGFAAAVVGLGLAGVAGGTVPPVAAVLLSRLHGDAAPRALLEINVLGAAAGVLASGVVAAAEGLVTWRTAVVLPVVVGALLAAGASRAASRAGARRSGPHEPAPTGARMPAPARWYVVVAVLYAVVEFGVVYWAPDLVMRATGLSAAAASGTLVAFTGGLVVGRAAISLVAGSLQASRWALSASLVLATLGGLGLVAAQRPATAVVALAVVGLGSAAVYPLCLALAVAEGAVAGAGARSSAALSVAVGLTALTAPAALAAGAEQAGIGVAFRSIPLAAASAAVVTVVAWRVRRPVADATGTLEITP